MKAPGIVALADNLATFRWFGTEYMVDAGYAPRRKLLDELEAETQASQPDVLVWDDVAVDFHVRTCRLRLVRCRAPVGDARLAAQTRGRGRVAVRKTLLRELISGGCVTAEAGPADAFQWLVENGSPDVLELPEQFRFVGPTFEHRYEKGPVPMPATRARSVAVILNYRDHADVTIRCLEHLARQVLTADLEVIVVDNRSLPEERARVDVALAQLFPRRPAGASAPRTMHLTYDAPFNLSDQNNFAVRQTCAEVIVLLNNDCFVLDPDCIQTLSDWALMPGVGSAAPRMVGAGGRLMTAGVNAGTDPGTGALRIWECEFPVYSRLVRFTAANSTACAAINRAAWDGVRGMDAETFPSQYDDADLCLRMARQGWSHLYVGSTAVFHEPGTTEERKKVEIARLMDRLLARHDLSSVSQITPCFEVLKKGPKLTNDDARVWRDFVGSFQRVVNWLKEVEEGAPVDGGETVLAAWAELESMVAEPVAIPVSSRQSDLWYQDEQCRLMQQCVRICTAFGDHVGDDGYDEILSSIEAHLRRFQIAATATSSKGQTV